MGCIVQDIVSIIPHQLLSRGETPAPEQWCLHPVNRRGLTQVTMAQMRGLDMLFFCYCCSRSASISCCFTSPLSECSTAPLSETDDALVMVGTDSSVSSVRIPCLGVSDHRGLACASTPGGSHSAQPQKLLKSEGRNTFPMGDSAGTVTGTSTPNHTGTA